MDMIYTMCLNLAYAGGGVLLGILSTLATFRLFDKLTPFNTSTELKNGNLAVAIFSGAIMLSASLLTSIIIGMAAN